MRITILLAGLLAGCPLVDPVDVTELVDEGELCIGSDGRLVVDWQTCLSSSCDTLTDATCDATLDGGTLTVTSYGRIESQGTTCTDDCGFAAARCDLPLIEDPSTVTVSHGTATVALDAIPDCEFL